MGCLNHKSGISSMIKQVSTFSGSAFKRLAATTAALLITGCSAITPELDVDEQTEAYISAARADIREEKVVIINQAMRLSPEEHDKFWHEYYQYQAERKLLMDKKVKLIRDYGYNYDRMNDDISADLATRWLDIEQQSLDLLRKYFSRIKDATSAATAARFLQVEDQLIMMMDLETASELPLLQKKN